MTCLADNQDVRRGVATPAMVVQALDFLDQLLVYDGKKRLTARNAALVYRFAVVMLSEIETA